MMEPLLKKKHTGKPEPKLYDLVAEKKLNLDIFPAKAGRGEFSRYKMNEERG